jgi:tetratricopeptide (TPR) repeat protein/tRNA A-37 threonylcarbamoyl transferase component Bud32
MADDNRILELVEEALYSDRTPEEVCANNPELLADVRAGLDECRRVDLMLEGIFPSTPAQRILSPQSQPGAPLPEIPGYEVLAILGRGGHGIVYRVRHLKLKRVAALKMLLTGQYASPAELARFMREAEAIAALQHPNIVQVYDVGEVDGRPYFTMEFVGGGSLAQKLGGVPQPAQYSASVAESLARAIHTAHLAGIIHRDVKPSNVLLALDGTPKISDFGLARSLEGHADVTLGPAKVGTPSYMAPEQVVGNPSTVGPQADIYALGATLYELLTGRPPFRGETATETERQLLTREPVPPSQLNAKVPPDLETICLKCLQKEPTRRYENALALADDLRRFEQGRPIQARPAGRGERAWRWCRRNPTMAALLLMALALVGLVSGGGTWLLQQRSQHNIELRSEIGTAVIQAVSLRKGFHFHEARELLAQARLRLGPAAPEDLRRLVGQAQADLGLVERLDKARSRGAALFNGRFNLSGAEPLYVSAFADAGLDPEGHDSKLVAARVRESTLRTELVAALDDWASLTPDRGRRALLLEIARQSDPDPARNRFRDPELWQDGARLTQLAKEPIPAALSPQLATALARVARESHADAVPLLTAAYARFPNDFWLNVELADALFEAQQSNEALGYLRAAVSLRPTASVAHQALGVALRTLGRADEALDSFQEALRIDPDFVWGHINLAMALYDKGRRDEAIDQYQQALRLDPSHVAGHVGLGLAFRDKGRFDEAVEQFQQALQIDPKSVEAHTSLGAVLNDKGRRDEALDQFQQALRINPKSAGAHVWMGTALSDAGRLPEAVGHFEQAVSIDPESELNKGRLCNVRFRAACAAVLAATGPDTRNGHTGDPERAALHRQALGWLRANLELMKRANEGKVAMASLSTWQQERALASVRDPAELARLPAELREQWQQLWAEVAAQTAVDPLEQGRIEAARGQWNRAADGYASYFRVLKHNPTDGHFWFEYAALSLLAGDRSGYTTACSHMVDTYGKPGGPRAYHIARTCTLAPDAVADAALPGRFAATELHANAKQFWSLTEQGALAYRAGRFEESVPLFEQSLAANSQPGTAIVNWLWLALANQRLGKTDEARRWLNKAQTWLDQYREGMPPRAEQNLGLHLHNWLEANVLRREAEALISSK